MKKAVKIVAAMIGLVAIVVGLACSVSGCQSVDCSNSDSAEFPVVEKWWK